VPEPAAATKKLKHGQTVLRASFTRIGETIRDIRRYRELFKYLVAFLIYNDAIGTIIGVAAIYGAELGFDSIQLILALLLVQFVGVPFSLIFGRLPSKTNRRRPFFLAFILFNLLALPLVGIVAARALPQNITGVLLPDYPTVGASVGTGKYTSEGFHDPGSVQWENFFVTVSEGSEHNLRYVTTGNPSARIDFPFNGQDVTVTYSTGADHGIWAVLLDGEPLLEEGAEGKRVPVMVDSYSPTVRYGVTQTFNPTAPGEHVLSLVNTGQKNPASSMTAMSIGQIEVLRPVSASSLPTILALLAATQLVGLLFAWFTQSGFVGLAERLTTRSSILLALVVYSVIAVWGYFIESTLEFWFLACMVATVQGGSQALSRSLFASMSPASKSGEFFGLFGVMEKFSSFIGPLLFAFAAATFGSSRPAILALIAFFIIGGYLLTRVNVEEGRRVAQAEDAAVLGATD
jgi:MFS family permease